MNLSEIGKLPKSEGNFLRANGWIPVQDDKWMASIKVGIYQPGDTLSHRAAVLATRNAHGLSGGFVLSLVNL